MKKLLIPMLLLILMLGPSCGKNDEVGCWVCERYAPWDMSNLPMNWTWEMLENEDEFKGWKHFGTDVYCEYPEDGYLQGDRYPVKYECKKF